MIIISIDPGSTSGWAILDTHRQNRPNLIDSGQLNQDDEYTWQSWWKNIDKVFTCMQLVCLVCEDQFIQRIPQYAAPNVAKRIYAQQVDALKISSSAGQWEGCAKLYGWQVLPRIHPQTWKHALFGSCKNVNTKLLALAWVQSAWKLKLKNKEHHRAEAICIGCYIAKQQQLMR